MTEPLDLMRAAAWEAAERLRSVLWQRDIDTVYAPLAETLIWITGLSEALGKREELLYSGLAYARNCTVHGRVVVSDVFQQHPGEPSPLLGDNVRRVYQGPASIWGFTRDPEPTTPGHATRRAAFNARVANHAIYPMLDLALLHLGVNIWTMGKADLSPRSAPRRYSIPPGAGPDVGVRPL